MDKATQELLDSYVAKIKDLEDSAPRIELIQLQRQYSLLNESCEKLVSQKEQLKNILKEKELNNISLHKRNQELEEICKNLEEVVLSYKNFKLKMKKVKKKSKLYKKIIMFLISKEVVTTDATLIYSNKSS